MRERRPTSHSSDTRKIEVTRVWPGCNAPGLAAATNVAAKSGDHDFRMQTPTEPAVRSKVQNPGLAIFVGLVGSRVMQRKGLVHRSAAGWQRTGDRGGVVNI